VLYRHSEDPAAFEDCYANGRRPYPNSIDGRVGE